VLTSLSRQETASSLASSLVPGTPLPTSSTRPTSTFSEVRASESTTRLSSISQPLYPQPIQIQQSGPNVSPSTHKEEVVTNSPSVKKVLERGGASRRRGVTASSALLSRLCWYVHYFAFAPLVDMDMQGLINLAGSGIATSDKERKREGKRTNTRLVPPSLNVHEST